MDVGTNLFHFSAPLAQPPNEQTSIYWGIFLLTYNILYAMLKKVLSQRPSRARYGMACFFGGSALNAARLSALDKWIWNPAAAGFVCQQLSHLHSWEPVSQDGRLNDKLLLLSDIGHKICCRKLAFTRCTFHLRHNPGLKIL